MKRARLGVVAMVFVIAGPVMAPTPSAAARDRGTQLLYRGDLHSPGLVADSTVNAVHGAISTGGGATVESVVGPRRNRFLRFPGGSCAAVPAPPPAPGPASPGLRSAGSAATGATREGGASEGPGARASGASASGTACPQAIVRPTSSATLVPGDAGAGRFSFGADIRLTEAPSTVAGMNVFQFGAAGAGLHQWKLQVDFGRPSCRWSDGTAVVLLPAGGESFTLNTGTWYRVRCTRLTSTLFETRVSHPLTGLPVTPPSRHVVAMGPILPAGAAVIGGKRINAAQSDVDTDQFHGDLDEIYFWRQ